MNLRHLSYFEVVARHQHISRAAAELMIAQPALSKQLRELEEDLGGVQLFERVGRNIRLTEAGRQLQQRAITILREVEAAKAELRAHAAAEGGRVSIGTPPTVGLRLLPDALAIFHQQHPHVELHIRESSTQGLLTLLAEGEIDMAVVTMQTNRRDLEVFPLFEEELRIVLSLQHPLAKQEWVNMSDLADQAFLLYPAGFEMREVTLQSCKQAGFVPRVVLDGGEMDMLLRLAEVGLGLALMPPLALIGNNRLASLRVQDQQLRRRMVLAARRDRALTPVALAMRQFLAEKLRVNPYSV